MFLEEYNKDNLKIEQIDEIVTRVKAFLINEKNEILVAMSNNGYQLPGGHIEDNEDLIDGLIREVCEETGITLSKQQISAPFFELSHLSQNYKNSGKNRQNKVLYFAINNNQAPDLSKIKLTETEALYNFTTILIPFDKFSHILKENIRTPKAPINAVIENEMLKAFEYLKLHKR
jgi:ADP-ribose pyrophosphatase YjhB (NUDIX family)